MRKRHRLITLLVCVAVAVAVMLIMAQAALAVPFVPVLTVTSANSPYTVSQSTAVGVLVIKPGGVLVAPDGKEVTLTVKGVEMGGVLESTAGTKTLLSKPGVYAPALLTVTDQNLFVYSPAGPPGTPTVTFPFRQALYLDSTGLVDAKSVPAAVIGPKPVAPDVKNVKITSRGEDFDGIFVAGGAWNIVNPKISLTGNGRSDFCGYGAGIVVNGAGTSAVIDKANIVNTGVARSAIVAEGSASVVVKNSYLETRNGILPSDYVPTIDTAQMRSVPWMLSLSGNVRTTNLLGTNTKASYINSTVKSQGWGVLSTDGCTTPTLTAINSKIEITGKDGYGSYGIGDATENFLGDTFNVATYATISRGSFLHYGDSTPAAVSALNTSLGLGLTPAELAAIPNKATVVNSKRFGIMWHGGGTLDVTGGTVFNTKEATFLDKGQEIAITVDGSKGVRLNPANGVLMQVMDDDDPGPNFATMQNTNTYHEPAFPPAKIATWDLNSKTGAASATFTKIFLNGSFYNSITSLAAGGPPGAPPADPTGKNLYIELNQSALKGQVTASEAHHSQADISAADYRLLGEVTNTPHQAINNGVWLQLNSSCWMVAGTSYLTKLVIGQHSTVVAPAGMKLVVTIDDDFDGPHTAKPVTLIPCRGYTGYITINVVPV